MDKTSLIILVIALVVFSVLLYSASKKDSPSKYTEAPDPVTLVTTC